MGLSFRLALEEDWVRHHFCPAHPLPRRCWQAPLHDGQMQSCLPRTYLAMQQQQQHMLPNPHHLCPRRHRKRWAMMEQARRVWHPQLTKLSALH